jgi:hypothetical protein
MPSSAILQQKLCCNNFSAKNFSHNNPSAKKFSCNNSSAILQPMQSPSQCILCIEENHKPVVGIVAEDQFIGICSKLEGAAATSISGSSSHSGGWLTGSSMGGGGGVVSSS